MVRRSNTLEVRPQIIAIEGVSGTGKTSVVAAVGAVLEQEHAMRVRTLACHVDIAGGDNKVPGLATSTEEQREFFEFFIEIESQRWHSVYKDDRSAVVLLDRSVFSLMAHASAVEQLLGFEVSGWLDQRLSRQPSLLWPEVVVRLDIDDRIIDQRCGARMPEQWWRNPSYNAAIRAYWDGLGGCSRGIRINAVSASGAVADVAHEVAEIVL
jgi:dTMP kinase